MRVRPCSLFALFNSTDLPHQNFHIERPTRKIVHIIRLTSLLTAPLIGPQEVVFSPRHAKKQGSMFNPSSINAYLH